MLYLFIDLFVHLFIYLKLCVIFVSYLALSVSKMIFMPYSGREPPVNKPTYHRLVRVTRRTLKSFRSAKHGMYVTVVAMFVCVNHVKD